MRQLMTSEYYAGGQRLLLDWDYTQPADSAAAAYFNVVWKQRPAADLPRPAPGVAVAGRRPALGRGDAATCCASRTASGGTTRPPRAWWRTATRSSREAMRDARDELTRQVSVSPTTWTWGHLHRLDLENQSLGQSSIGLVARSSTGGRIDVGGGSAIVDATSWDAAAGYDVDLGAPSMRMVVDLDDLDRVPLGQPHRRVGPRRLPALPRPDRRSGSTGGRCRGRSVGRRSSKAAEHRLVLEPAKRR